VAVTAQEAVRRIKEHLSTIRGFGVKKLGLFGSVARDQSTETSDVDVLVEFEAAATFDGYMDLKFFLEDLLGTRVDLVTRAALRDFTRESVERDLVHVA